MSLPEPEILHSIVARIFRVDEFTLGDPKQGYYLRYRGELLVDSVAAYDQLAEAMRPYEITPMFRIEEGRQTILLINAVIRPKPGRASINLFFFLLTLISVLFTGAAYSYTGPLPETLSGQLLVFLTHIWVGWPFAVGLLAILLAHEFGHYFVGKARGAAVSLPFFLPLPYPFSLLGTLGAFIQLKDLPKNKRALFDLGIAGPLAGLVVAVPVLVLGLLLSDVGPVEDTSYTKTATSIDLCVNTAAVGETYTCSNDNMLEGNSLLYLGLKYIIKGELLPAPATYDQPVLLYWLRYFFIGSPIPLGGLDVVMHPLVWAGWIGLLVTLLNLIPAGQLDGGHILYAVFGKRIQKVWMFIMAILFVLGFFWSGWWLWAGLIFLFGRSHAEPLDQITQLDPPRKALAVLMLVVFLLVLTPIPLVVF